MGSTLFRDPQARSSALAALRTLQPQAFGSLNRVDPLDSVSIIYDIASQLLDLQFGMTSLNAIIKLCNQSNPILQYYSCAKFLEEDDGTQCLPDFLLTSQKCLQKRLLYNDSSQPCNAKKAICHHLLSNNILDSPSIIGSKGRGQLSSCKLYRLYYYLYSHLL